MTDFAGSWQLEVTQADGDPEAAQFRCQSPDDEIQVSGTARRTERGVVVTEMSWSTQRPNGLTSRTNRRVPIGEIISALRSSPSWQPPSSSDPSAVRCTCAAEARMPGRAPLTDDLLRRVAVAYLEETAPGKDRAAVTRVAARFDRPVKTINNWIARARNEGWLGPAAQGRAGADPGPRLLEAKS